MYNSPIQCIERFGEMPQPLFYVYVHRRATTGEPFYVGKGKGPRWRSANRNRYWHRVVAKHGVEREIVGSFNSEQEAFDAEIALIAKLRGAGCNLVNLTDGGEGASGVKLSKRQVEKRKAQMKELQASPVRAARAKAASQSPEVRSRVSAGVKAAFSDPEVRQKIKDGLKRALAKRNFRAGHGDKIRAAADRRGRVIYPPAMTSEQMSAYQSARFSESIWITNGVINHRLKPNACVPEGWVKGRITSAEKVLGAPDLALSAMQKRLTPKGRPKQDGQNNNFYGKKHTDEWRKEHSARMKGRPHKPEAVEKRAAARRGNPLSAEYKAALSAGKKGKMVFNNGVTFKFFAAGDAIPEGWVRGRPKKT